MSKRAEKLSAAAWQAWQAQIEKPREQIAARKRERAEIEAASLPRGEIRANLEASLDKFPPRWDPTVDLTGRLRELVAPDLVRGVTTEVALEGLLVTIARPALVDALMAHIERALGGRAPGLPAAERPAKIAELEARIFALECEEERLIEEAEAAGIIIERRADADPCAVLGLDPPRRAA